MHLAVVHAKLAPYHRARLRALAAHASSRGGRVTVIEVARTQRDYAWAATPSSPEGYLRTTLFEGRDYWDVGYRETRRALGKALDASAPDVLVLPGWGFRESLAGLGWAARRGVRRILLSDSQPIDTPRRAAREAAKRVLVRSFDAALVGGAPHARYVEALGLPRERILPGCDVVDNSAFAGARRRRADDAPQLVSVLRLLPRKNAELVLAALARAPAWSWVLVGEGPHRAVLEAEAARLGVTDRVAFLGHVPDETLPQVLADADVYVQPSLSEPWGLAVNEAMAAGKPVLVSTACGCREDLVVEGVDGMLFDPGSVESLADALRRMLNERARWPQMGEASRKIVAGWDLDLYARNLWSLAGLVVERPVASSIPARWL